MTQTDEPPQTLEYKAIITDELLARMKSHVFVVFWPVLYLNLLYIKCWVSLRPVRGNAYVAVRFSVFGQIQLKYGGQLFYEDGPELTDMERLEALPSWDGLQAKLLSNIWTTLSADTCAGKYPWISMRLAMRGLTSSPWMPACAGIYGVWGASGKKLDPGWALLGHPSTGSG